MSVLENSCSHCGAKLLHKAIVCVRCGKRVPVGNINISRYGSTGNNTKKINMKVVAGVYGVSGAIGIFSGLVPAIGIIIVTICLNITYIGLAFLVAGIIYVLIQRGLFGWIFIIVGFFGTMLFTLYRLELLGNITTSVRNVFLQ